MFKEVTKLYKDKYVDLRDYTVKEAIKNKKNIVVIHEGKYMTLTPDDLRKKRLILNKEPVKSFIYPDQEYYLYSYLWKEDKKLSKDEEMEELARSGVFG